MRMWAEITGESGYMVSDEGRIKSPSGYIFRENETATINRSTYRVNRLVAMHFLPNPSGLPNVRNKNRDKTDNRVENLEWTSDELNRKLSDEKIEWMLHGRYKNWSHAKVAREYGVNVKTIRKWRK